MRTRVGHAGFTIIETVLFLAISSLMVIAAMSAVNGRTQQVQFTDSIRSLESFFEGKLDSINNGSISGDTLACRYVDPSYTIDTNSTTNDGSCTFLGYLFQVGDRTIGAVDPMNSEIDVFQVFGKRINSSDPCVVANPDEPLFCASPYAYATPVQSYSVLWGIEVSESLTASGEEVNVFGYLRNPIGLSLIPVAVRAGYENSLRDPNLYLSTSANSWIGDEFSVSACFTDTKRDARITLGNSDRQYAIELNMETSTAGCP